MTIGDNLTLFQIQQSLDFLALTPPNLTILPSFFTYPLRDIYGSQNLGKAYRTLLLLKIISIHLPNYKKMQKS